MKKLIALFYLLLTFSALSALENLMLSTLDRAAFYNAMASGKMEEVNSLLAVIRASSLSDKEAFEGALLMKKAGLVAKVKEKLSLFKEGRKKLEASIKNNGDNAEYCFLRLIIQEHAPKALEYRSDIDHDSKLIRSNYKNLPQAVQLAITDYSKKSKALKGLLP